KPANPLPMGLAAFAGTAFVLSCSNANCLDLSIPNIAAPMSYFFGGFVLGLAGLLAFFQGDTYTSSVFVPFAAFWMSWAAINTESFGVLSAYSNDSEQLGNALGFYLLSWAILCLFLWICTFKGRVDFFLLIGMVFLLFLVLSIANFTGSANVTKAGGVIGIIVAAMAWYIMYTELATTDNSYINI
ncbi:acetate uptake transporter family protein ASCRUDRAFT_25518, partial [Ascoidea rubescens DSM 1968]